MSLGIVLLGCERGSHPTATRLLDGQLAVAPHDVVRLISGATATRRPVRVNSPPQAPDEVVLLVVPHNRLSTLRFRGLADNCTALEDEPTIVCDAVFLARFPESVLGRPLKERERVAFAFWVIGHELGHTVHGDGGFHYAPNPESPSMPERNLESQRREYAADCWMIDRLLAIGTPELTTDLERLAIDFINVRVRSQTPEIPFGVGILYDYRRVDPYNFTGAGSHPDLLLRGVRLLHISAQRRNRTGGDPMVSAFVRRLVPDPLWRERGPCSLTSDQINR